MEIKLKGLTKEFSKKEGNVVAVDHIDVTIPSGKLIGLLGPSGCGKSTTLYMIAGLHQATDGEIYFGDQEVSKFPPEKRGIGLVFQNYALYPHLTVRQNIMFPLENRKDMTKEERLARAQEMADLVNIGNLMDRKPAQLSGGQQQRVAIARAIAKMPKVLLLDEPLSNLDARLRLQTREEIKRIQQRTGITTIFVTHDQEEAMSISDEIVVMSNGLVQQIGKPQEVYDEPKNLFVAKFLGTPPINVVEGFFKKDKVLLGDKALRDVEFTGEDRKVVLGIRPEFIKIVEENGIDATIDFVEFIGRDKIVIFKLENGALIKGVIPAEVSTKVGEKVKIDFNRMFIFEENGERIL